MHILIRSKELKGIGKRSKGCKIYIFSTQGKCYTKIERIYEIVNTQIFIYCTNYSIPQDTQIFAQLRKIAYITIKLLGISPNASTNRS